MLELCFLINQRRVARLFVISDIGDKLSGALKKCLARHARRLRQCSRPDRFDFRLRKYLKYDRGVATLFT